MALKKELEKALDFACDYMWGRDLPNGQCENCVMILNCRECWKNYFLKKARNGDELKQNVLSKIRDRADQRSD